MYVRSLKCYCTPDFSIGLGDVVEVLEPFGKFLIENEIAEQVELTPEAKTKENLVPKIDFKYVAPKVETKKEDAPK